MASESSSQPSRPPMSAPELIAFVQKELDADDERQARVTPASASELPTGSTLDLSHKNISALPLEVVLLIKDKVERLALSHNPRISIPLGIAQCDRLRYLNLRWNKLKHFPEAVLSLSKLEILDISKNAIDGIPEDIKNMTNLKFLAVARNQIRRLPLALGEMNLVKLKFDENPIEFPPLDALQPSNDRAVTVAESEKDKDMCQQVKRFMKAAALREKLRSHSEEDLSESNIETPRPPKRTATGGRFPVRPSISGIENIAGLNSDSPPDHPPPIPQRSHARVASSNLAPLSRRPGIAPLLTNGNETSRSRSETVATSANIRNRRQGYVPRKNTGLNSLSEMSSQMSARSTQAPTLTPPHSRAPSAASNYLGTGSGNESSSGAVSPIESSHFRAAFSHRLSSLPESRNSRLSTSNTTKAVKRGLFMLSYLNRPIADIARKLSESSPKKSRSGLERLLFSANAHVEELDRLINNANNLIEDNTDIDPALMMSIMRTAITALKMYVFVIKELKRIRQDAIDKVDTFHIRCVITTAYSTLIEARNICHILGFRTKIVNPRNTLRASHAWSSRTVTPTQPKSAGSRRRGPTILPNGITANNLRGMAPPVPLNSGSRSNTMTSTASMSPAVPRYNDSFASLPTVSQLPSRTNTLRSVASEVDSEEGPDYVYLKLRACCDLATQTLPSVRTELVSRKSHADRGYNTQASKMYAQAVNKCDFVIATNNKLLSRLKIMKVGDTLRHQKEFLSMTENFGRDWTTFANQIVELVNHGIAIGDIRQILKPLQRAVKNANKAASQPPRPSMATSTHGGFPISVNTGLAQMSGQVTPVPATPLGAALGPAVQATVPPTPVSAFGSPDPPQQPRSRPAPERTDTMIHHNSSIRR